MKCLVCDKMATDSHHIIARAYCRKDKRVVVRLCHYCHMAIHYGELKIKKYLDNELKKYLLEKYPMHYKYI